MRALEKAFERSGHSDREVNFHSLATKSAYILTFFFLKRYLQRLQKAKKLMEQSKQKWILWLDRLDLYLWLANIHLRSSSKQLGL